MIQPQKPTQEEILPLHPKEIELLFWLRSRWRYGEVTIKMENGVPKGVLRAFESKFFD